MSEFLCRTKGGAFPNGRPRVYFTCHPSDFDKSFNKICTDIFGVSDCAVFYTADMNEEIEKRYLESDLGRMSLFVIPITLKLLTEPCRAMNFDLGFASDNNIPVLPIMMEPGLDVIYSRGDKFGERQYLDPFSSDSTAISYTEKLKKFLDALLISAETTERIRQAFDAYIFLSYRKKDRHLANELMKKIHSYPQYRDIAIWYDEFLTPGESFRENIEKMMKDSKLFALLVTPSLLEYVDGIPNYVMAKEYPDAKRAGMDILPAEMEETDKDELRAKYEDIPECVRPNDADFTRRFSDTLAKYAILGNDKDPMHTFLIGLAYLDGIDVEKDTERAAELITSAAEASLPEAMIMLYDMYTNGKGVKVDYRKALVWAERTAKYYKERYGEEHPDTLAALDNLAYTYVILGESKRASELLEKVCELKRNILGEEHPDTLSTLNYLVAISDDFDDHSGILMHTKIYDTLCRTLGEDHPDTIASLNDLSLAYSRLEEREKALEISKKVYSLSLKIFGEGHPGTLTALGNLASAYGKCGDYKKELESEKIVYSLKCRLFGEEHPGTLTSLNNLSITYSKLGRRRRALSLHKKAYILHCKILGGEHPDTQTVLENLAYTCGKFGTIPKALVLKEGLSVFISKLLGKEDVDLVISIGRLEYFRKHQDERTLKLKEKEYTLSRRLLGKNHTDTLPALSDLICTCSQLGKHKKAYKLQKRHYALSLRAFGKEHPTTVKSEKLLFEYKEKL